MHKLKFSGIIGDMNRMDKFRIDPDTLKLAGVSPPSTVVAYYDESPKVDSKPVYFEQKHYPEAKYEMNEPAPKTESVRKRILLDLFASPVSVIPIIGGATVIIGSWALGLSSFVGFVGFSSVLAGFGLMASRLVFGLDKIAQNAKNMLTHDVAAQEERRMRELASRLGRVASAEYYPVNILTNLRKLYANFKKSVDEGKLSGSSKAIMVEKIDELYAACIQKLETVCDISESGHGLPSAAEKKCRSEYNKILQDVNITFEMMGTTIQDCYISRYNAGSEDLSAKREEMVRLMNVAKKTDEEMKNFGSISRETRNLPE